MTYIVDPKVIEGTVIDEFTKGQLIMGKSETDTAAFSRIIGPGTDALKVASEETHDLLVDIRKYLKSIDVNLREGSDLNADADDMEGM